MMVIDDDRVVWGVDLDEQTAIRCREVTAAHVWSRTVKIEPSFLLDSETLEKARKHFAQVPGSWAKEGPGQAYREKVTLMHEVRISRGEGGIVCNMISHLNGVGLSQDVMLLGDLLRSLGHDVAYFEWRDGSRKADVNFYLELFETRHFTTAKRHVGLFNLEWYDKNQTGHLRGMQCWAKSREAEQVYRSLGGIEAYYTSFLSRDLRRQGVGKERFCLHVMGKASQKGTDVVMEAWRRHGDRLPPLLITCAQHPDGGWRLHPKTEIRVGMMPLEELALLMNRAMIHLCPSEAEGWGHYIAEGLSCEAVVVTVDGSPMTEHVKPDHGVVVPAARIPQGLVMRYKTDPDVLAQAILRLCDKSDDDLIAMGKRARLHWERRQAEATRLITERMQLL